MTTTVGDNHPAVKVRQRAFLLAALLFVAFTSQAAFSQTPGDPPMVEDVIIEGLRSLPAQSIKAQLRTVPGQPYNLTWIQDDLARLGKLNVSKPPRQETLPVAGTNAVIVKFIVEELPGTVQSLEFHNARHATQEELEGITNLRRGLTLSPSLNRQACQLIVDWYKREQGRYFASCVLEEGGSPSDSRVVFNITEGPVVRIRNINFTGNETLASSARLYSQISTWKRFLAMEMTGSKFEIARIEADTAKLQDYYQSNGYLDARVTREQHFTDDFNYVDVTFHIWEGMRYHIKDVAVRGTTVLPVEQVESVLKIRKGDQYDGHVVEADARIIQDLYGWRGYPAVVQTKKVYCDPNTEPGLVQIQYEVIEKKPFKVGELKVIGNDVTKFRVIYHFLNIYPGQILPYPALKQGEAALARSNLFDMEERPTITPIDRDDPFDDEYKDILIRVKETMTGSLMFGASVNSDAGLVGSIVLNERNFDILRPPTSFEDVLEGRAFRGGGQELRLEALPGTQVQRYSATLREPFLFDLPYALTTSGYYYQRSYTEDLETRYGFNVSINHALNRNWTVGVGLRLENVNISQVPFFAPPEYLAVVGDNFIVAPRVMAAYDTRDSYLRPTEGERIQVQYEQLLGDFTSPLVSVEASKFFTVAQRPDGSGRQVVMVRSQAAWAGNDTPVFEKYYAGGTNSMRGFEFRGVGPMVNGFNVGGDFIWLNSVEYQLPVLANDMVWLVAFVDSGTVERDISIHDYRVAAGVGARITVPMLGQVPIALDFGFPIVRASSDRTQMFSFSVGFFH
jgi:outer membrane protein assembly factor BamA